MPLFTDLFDPGFLGTDIALKGGTVPLNDHFDVATVSDVENVKAAIHRRLSPETSSLTFLVRDVSGLKQIAAPTTTSLSAILSEPLTTGLALTTRQLVLQILAEEDRIDVVAVNTNVSTDASRPGITITIQFIIRASQEGGFLALIANRATGYLEVL